MIDSYRRTSQATRLATLVVSALVLLCLGATSAQALTAHSFAGGSIGKGQTAWGPTSRHLTGATASAPNSQVSACVGAYNHTQGQYFWGTCGMGGAGSALALHLYYGHSIQPYVYHPNATATIVKGTWYEDTAAMWAGENRYQVSHMFSRSGKYRATIQHDGNFVVYNNQTGKACWWSGTNGWVNSYVSMQNDGNLVVYRDNGQWLWQSGTNGNPGSFLLMQDDGNLVVYNSNSQPLWWSGTAGCQ